MILLNRKFDALRAVAAFMGLVALLSSNQAIAGSLTDVRALVYSRTAAEVFWTRTDRLDRVEVRLDDRVVGIYDASSRFFENLPFRNDQRIDLRIVSTEGEYSEAVTLLFGTADFDGHVRQILPEPSSVATETVPVTETASAPTADETEALPATPDVNDHTIENACVADAISSLSNCIQAARNNRLARDGSGVGHIELSADIRCGSNCCPSGNALLNLSDTSRIQLHGNGFRVLRQAGQRNCSLLTAHDADKLTLNNIVLDDDETVAACVVTDRCPRMLHMRDASSIALSNVTVRHSKGYAIYVRATNGFRFEDSTLEHSGVLGLYIGHEDDASRNISILNSRFTDNSTNALALLGVVGTNVIEGNTFERNHTIGQWPVAPRFGTGLTGGGQVYIARASNVRFENNRVADGHCSNCYWHGRLGTGVTGVELGKPRETTVSNILINNNVIENNDAYAVAANVTSPIDASVRVTNNQIRGNGANWRLNGAALRGNSILE